MYIKLTKFDNTPIWLNAAFIVTIEPRKQGGSVVVPIGDGLDYDVRESPEAVLAMLEGAPVPTVVPVPAPEGLTQRPDDVSAEPLVMSKEDVVELKSEAKSVATPAEGAESKPAAKKKSVKKPAARKSRTKKAALALSEEQVERLKKMAPGSEKKLANTLTTQFKVEDAEALIVQLADRGVLAVDHGHIIWK